MLGEVHGGTEVHDIWHGGTRWSTWRRHRTRPRQELWPWHDREVHVGNESAESARVADERFKRYTFQAKNAQLMFIDAYEMSYYTWYELSTRNVPGTSDYNTRYR